jgi:S-adenosylmethionine:tRNA ribosyltransferase-isomerase
MCSQNNLLLSDFDYHLPQNLIASHPANPRESAKLLVVDDNKFTDATINDITDYFNDGDLLLFNDTKVIPARLYGHNNGRKIEIFLLTPQNENWQAFIKPAKKVKIGDIIEFAEDFHAHIIAKNRDGTAIINFPYQISDFWNLLDKYGHIPLPPYIKREDNINDKADYQTIFAKNSGAVAAPTAGLHFTQNMLDKIKAKNIQIAFLTLHVGAGTFSPVKVEKIIDHQIHSEICELSQATCNIINQTRKNNGKIIAVGTTTLRTIESATKINGEIQPFSGATNIFIYPSYQFKFIDMLLTNFHLPKSTLLMLVSAICGRERLLQTYQYAIANNYRFFSYGDACLFTINHGEK